MQVGSSGVALAGDTHADLGQESAVLIIRHVIVEAEPLAAARPEGHIRPQRHLLVRYVSRPTAGDGVREGRSQISVVCSVRK